MTRVEQLQDRRQRIVRELSQLDQMRRGSVVDQYVEATRKDGTRVRRGPYVLYSYKEEGKTVSRRITDPEQIPLYQQQIDRFRRFQQLSAELITLGEQLSELALSEPGVKKTSKRRSKSKKRRR